MKVCFMVFIQCIALAGSPEKLTGNAALNSDLWVDMGVAGDARVVFGGAGGKNTLSVGSRVARGKH